MEKCGNRRFFTGKEVEKTPFFGQTTVFVVGMQSSPLIVKKAQRCKATHVYLGADRSFQSSAAFFTYANSIYNQIRSLVSLGFSVTLDIHASFLPLLCGNVILKSRKVCVITSLPLPNVDEMKNVILKIDDITPSTNPQGVYCIPLKSLLTKTRRTPWSAYKKDKLC